MITNNIQLFTTFSEIIIVTFYTKDKNAGWGDYLLDTATATSCPGDYLLDTATATSCPGDVGCVASGSLSSLLFCSNPCQTFSPVPYSTINQQIKQSISPSTYQLTNQ